jgi:hypothetical protein
MMSLLPNVPWRVALIALLGLGVLSAGVAAADGVGTAAPQGSLKAAFEPSLAIEPAAAPSSDIDQQAVGRIAPVLPGADPGLSLRVGEHPGFSRLVFDWPMHVDYRVDHAPGRVIVRFDAPARLDLSHYLDHRLQRVTSVDPFEGNESLTVVLDTTAGAEVRHYRDSNLVVIDVAGDEVLFPATLISTETTETAETAELPGPEPEPDQGAPLLTSGARAAENQSAVLRFDWLPQGARAAAFRRGRRLWIVFDQRSSQGLAGEIAEYFPHLAPVERLTADNGGDATVLRVNLPPSHGAELSRDGNAWVIHLGRRADAPRTALAVEVAGADGALRLLLRAAGAGRVLSVTDPDLGDSLSIVPLPATGLGVKGARSYPQFRALATYQGIAVAAVSDGLQVDAGEAGVSIGDRSGLLLSSPAERAGAEAAGPLTEPGPRLFDQHAWRRESQGSFADVKQHLLGAVADASPARSDMARLDLARFYFAHGLAIETLQVLDALARENQRLAIDPQVLLLQAASEFLVDDGARAAETLDDPALDGEWEAALWQGALAAVTRDWAFAAERFSMADPLFADYGRLVRVRLRLLAAEARLGIGDSGGARGYMDELREDSLTLDERAQLDYLEGRRLNLDGDTAAARDLWQRLADGPHRPARTRARLALAEKELGASAETASGTASPTP